MDSYLKLLENNRAWSASQIANDPQYFENLVELQAPRFLWIGCSDSRVPANQITGTEPGEIFVHRNVANLVVNSDINMLSVLDFAINNLKVRHVIVCGHYGCGGIMAAMDNNDHDQILNMWLGNIKDVYRHHRDELESITDSDTKLRRLTELSVQEQVKNLTKTSIIQKAWSNQNPVQLHGWVYDLHDGIINPMIRIDASNPIDPIYEFTDM